VHVLGIKALNLVMERNPLGKGMNVINYYYVFYNFFKVLVILSVMYI
jgi:hypothetical protein